MGGIIAKQGRDNCECFGISSLGKFLLSSPLNVSHSSYNIDLFVIVQMLKQVLKESILVFYHLNNLYWVEIERHNVLEVEFSNHVQI